jgi:hypothetical protein
MVHTKVAQEINLIDGQFTPSEASDVMEALIREKINFHKVQRLQKLIGDCDSETGELNGRITELLEEKRKAKAFFAEARAAGRNIVINGTLEIAFAD